MTRQLWAIVLAGASAAASGQVLTQRPSPSSTSAPSSEVAAALAPATMPLTVTAGTPLKVALDKEVRIRKTGQPIHGKLVEPVYAFDKLVLPAGTEVIGKVASIETVSKYSCGSGQ